MNADDPKQTKRVGSIQQGKCNMQNIKMELLLKRCQRNDTVPVRNRLQSISNSSDTNLLEAGNESKRQEFSTQTNESSHENVTCCPYQKESLEKLYLDLESIGFRKVDEDNASDLSDSERTLPNTTPHLTPPKLNLKAEVFKPGYFSHNAEYKCKHYSYPDVLPPPYSTWNLSHVIKEKQYTIQSTTSRVLEKYVERLLQLERLQMQTVQSEKAKTSKSRPQTASSMSRIAKTPSINSPVCTKQIHNACSTSRNISSQDIKEHRKYLHPDISCRTHAHKSCTKVPEPKKFSVLFPTQDKKIQLYNFQQAKDMPIYGSYSKMQKESSGSSNPEIFKEPKQKFQMLQKVEDDQKPCCLQKYNSSVKCNGKHSDISQHKRKPK